MNEQDIELLEKHGWIVECESPFEIRKEESESFATNEAARIILRKLQKKTAKLQKKTAAAQ